MAPRPLAAADGQWPRLLVELAGLKPEQLQNRHQPCPACGGSDRYRWDQDAGAGGWFCNQCGGKDRRGGGGNGLDLLLRLTGWDLATAARRIEAHLGLPAAFPPASARSSAAGRPLRIPDQPPPDAPPPELGRATAQWCYRNGQGEPLFWVQRLELQQTSKRRKAFVQRTWLDGGWHFPSRRDPFRSDWPAPRPLYRLPELLRRPWAEVLIAEGEKAADAAAQLFPDHVVVSWCGGSQALQAVDWTPLAQRAVMLWPDADGPGRDAMAALSALLLELGCTVAVVLPPGCTQSDWDLADAPGAEGWDLADADWTPAEAQAYLQQHRRSVRRPAPAAAASGPVPAPKAPAGEPFACLGYDSDGYYYQPHSTGQVVRLASSSHGGMNLCRLALLSYWETLYPSRSGVNWTAAASDLFARQAAVGIFDPDCLRGRGAWSDEGRSVLHLGDRLVVDGRSQPITEPFRSRVHYQRGPAIQLPDEASPLSDQEAFLVLAMAERFHWEIPASALLLAGWVALATISGGLRWRPHLWLTAAAGSGKSTLLERFVGVLLGDFSLPVVGNTTEAFIRQALRSDALPVVIDEAESNEKSDQQRVQQILALARYASSETRASIGKGASTGDVQRFRVRSMFLLSSISTALRQGADRRRFSQLTLRNPAELPARERQRHWEELDRDLDALITAPYAARLLARTVELIPCIRQSVRVFSRVAAAHFDSQALGDQYGTLLAGAWALQSTRVPTSAEAKALIDGSDWSSFQQSIGLPDERRCLNRILQWELRVETEDRSHSRTVGELVETITMPGGLDPVSTRHAEDILSRHGMRIQDGHLLVSNTAEAIARILEDTPWGSSWSTILARLPGAQPTANSVRFKGAGAKARACSIPLESL